MSRAYLLVYMKLFLTYLAVIWGFNLIDSLSPFSIFNPFMPGDILDKCLLDL